MAKVTISFKDGTVQVFKDSMVDGHGIPGMFMVHPQAEKKAYFFPVADIRSAVVEQEADTVTESGIVVVKTPALVTPFQQPKKGK